MAMTPRQKLEALIDLFTGNIRSAFLAAIQDVVDNVVLERVIDAIEHGDPIAAFNALGFSPAAMRPLTAAIEQAFEQGGVMTGQTFPRFLNTPSGKTVFRFDVRNSRSEAFLRDRSGSLITKITSDALDVTQNTLAEGMQAGRNPRSVALDLVGRIDKTTGNRVGGVIGLTPQQERWVSGTRRDLQNLDSNYFTRALRDKRFDGIVQKAIDTETPLDADTISKLVTRYNANALRYRGETIARTEAIQSLNASEYEAVKQAVDMGAVNQNATKRIWDATGDDRTRESHMLLNGQAVGMNEPFVSKLTGAKMMFPGDISLGAPGSEIINCRCRARLKVDWLSDLD